MSLEENTRVTILKLSRVLVIHRIPIYQNGFRTQYMAMTKMCVDVRPDSSLLIAC